MAKKMNLKKHTLHLRAGDFDYLSTICAEHNVPTVTLVRRIISRYVDDLRKKEAPMDTTLMEAFDDN